MKSLQASRHLAHRITGVVALGLVLASVTTPIRTQDPTGKEPEPGHQKTVVAIEKLDAWPKLGKQEAKRVLACMKQFRKDKQKLRDGARDRIVALGAGAAPLVLRQVNDRADNINEQLFAVLDAILKPAHGSLMARELRKPSFELRHYLVRRLAKFHDRDLIPVLQRTAKDKAPEIAFHAALGLLGLRQRDALDPVLEYSKAHWQDVGDDIATVLPAARSGLAGNWVFETINKRGAADQMAGLRLVRYLGTKDHNVILKRYLQASQHPVKKAAINALRMIHGEKPLEKLSVFQVIDHAKKWMGKI
ncbi:MAG: HEAT repeat domain-containing protein [bacterium]|nr:HEAT repeat domain-containing protein [bacterium]